METWIVQILQIRVCSGISTLARTKIALDRIATYLDEDEVNEQVSSLKKSLFGTSGADDETAKGLGIENGTFKWNEVEPKGDTKDKNGQNDRADRIQPRSTTMLKILVMGPSTVHLPPADTGSN